MTPESSPAYLVLARLREEIRRIERRPTRRGGAVPCGIPEVDAVLPAGGFPRGALSDVAGGVASGKTAVALSVFAALGQGELAAFVDGRGELYPPAARALGVDLPRLLIVRPTARAEGGRGEGRASSRDPALAALWAAEALLGSGAFAAVAIDVPVPRDLRRADAALRRLHTAAEKGGAVGLWLGPAGAAARPPAAVRIELSACGPRISARRTVGGVAVPERAGGGRVA